MIQFYGYAFVDEKQSNVDIKEIARKHNDNPHEIDTRTVELSGFGLAVHFKKGESDGISIDENRKIVVVIKGSFAPSVFPGAKYKNGRSEISEALLNKYMESGVDSLVGLNGRYALVVWDGYINKLFIITDHLGMQRLCWSRDGDKFLFGTHYHPFRMLSQRRFELNDLSVAEACSFGYPMQNKTLFNEIYTVSNGVVGDISRSSVHWYKYSDLLEKEQTKKISIEHCANILGETFDEVFADYGRLIDKQLTIPLSGGLDSRTILGFALRANIKNIKSFSYGHRHTYDVRLGRKLANAARTKHKYVNLPNSYVQDFLDSDINATEGESPAHSFHCSILGHHLSRDDILWHGFLGDTLSGKRVYDYEIYNDYEKKFDVFYNNRFSAWRGVPQGVFSKLITQEYRDIFFDGPRETVKQELDRFKGFAFWQATLRAELTSRQSRFIALSLDMLNNHCNVFAPFYDKRIVDAYLSFPLEALQGQRAYRKAIIKFCPELATVPADRFMRNLVDLDRVDGDIKKLPSASDQMWSVIPHSVKWRVNNYLRVNDRRIRFHDALARITGGWLGNHDRNAYAHYDIVIAKHAPSLTGLLNDENLFYPYFDIHYLRKFIHNIQNESQAFLAFNILTYAYWKKITMGK